ncbi:hypothetical protein E4T56_gene19331 [Termitomyces sp. T112]|nr:hypothetical protein E4T56_gene19331 [Termitomyces sp. T112]KAH0581688.1 hypothetical protein H2248_011378 [Termitomyces sp. 'cryptogamus']
MASRKAGYKLPPTTITDRLISQEARRNKALEEQKRRRAQRFESTRNLDSFADLTLGLSDHEDDAEDEDTTPLPCHGSVAQYASMLSQPVDPTSIATHTKSSSTSLHPETNESPVSGTFGNLPSILPKKPNKKRRRGKPKTNKWADRCMYAELLEMVTDPSDAWSSSGADGLPADLENGWVALAPVPQGKRCLAVTQSAADSPSQATLRSRLLGKVLLNRFPSVLPPHTILDCVLDNNWKDNGVLHVLDVIKWKGQDVSECESAFRFWWRDTRLGELPPTALPQSHCPKSNDITTYTFPYPTTFLPVPYHTDTTLPSFLTHIVPSVRLPRSVSIVAPSVPSQDMDVDFYCSGQPAQTKEAIIQSDGLLLYVRAASYESGTSPLSSWVPIVSYDGPQRESPLDLFERLLRRRMAHTSAEGRVGEVQEVDVEMEL